MLSVGKENRESQKGQTDHIFVHGVNGKIRLDPVTHVFYCVHYDECGLICRHRKNVKLKLTLDLDKLVEENIPYFSYIYC